MVVQLLLNEDHVRKSWTSRMRHPIGVTTGGEWQLQAASVAAGARGRAGSWHFSDSRERRREAA